MRRASPPPQLARDDNEREPGALSAGRRTSRRALGVGRTDDPRRFFGVGGLHRREPGGRVSRRVVQMQDDAPGPSREESLRPKS